MNFFPIAFLACPGELRPHLSVTLRCSSPMQLLLVLLPLLLPQVHLCILGFIDARYSLSTLDLHLVTLVKNIPAPAFTVVLR